MMIGTVADIAVPCCEIPVYLRNLRCIGDKASHNKKEKRMVYLMLGSALLRCWPWLLAGKEL